MSEKTYKIIKQIGKGSYGIVYLCQNQKNKELCVVKSIDLSSLNEKEKEETINESKILQKLDHQNIIKFIDFFINKEKKTLKLKLINAKTFFFFLNTRYSHIHRIKFSQIKITFSSNSHYFIFSNITINKSRYSNFFR